MPMASMCVATMMEGRGPAPVPRLSASSEPMRLKTQFIYQRPPFRFDEPRRRVFVGRNASGRDEISGRG